MKVNFRLEKKHKKVVGISLIVSAVTMLVTMLAAPSKENRKASRTLGVLAALEALVGLAALLEEPGRLLRRKAKEPLLDEEELFFEDEEDDAVTVVHAVPPEIPCDEEASEADFM